MGMFDNIGENGFITNTKNLATKSDLAELKNSFNDLKSNVDDLKNNGSDKSVWKYDESTTSIRPKNMDEIQKTS